MLLGQHFSAISAAEPINRPILAAIAFGWVPALIWCLAGSIFIGGVHDMGSLAASVRNKSRSITDLIRSYVSNRAWMLFMLFIWITLVYVIIDITASSFVGNVMAENGETVLGLAGHVHSGTVYVLSNRALVSAVHNGWVLKKGHASILIISIVLIIISVRVVVETIISMTHTLNKGLAPEAPETCPITE